jgi:ferritin
VKKHEQGVTRSIEDLYGLAQSDKDFASQVFLEWFITEQVEEEKSSAQVLESVRRVGDNQAALVMLDRELGQRNSKEKAEKSKS